jgi:hypothetical protein
LHHDGHNAGPRIEAAVLPGDASAAVYTGCSDTAAGRGSTAVSSASPEPLAECLSLEQQSRFLADCGRHPGMEPGDHAADHAEGGSLGHDEWTEEQCVDSAATCPATHIGSGPMSVP